MLLCHWSKIRVLYSLETLHFKHQNVLIKNMGIQRKKIKLTRISQNRILESS